jgi:phage terminase large subunit-like protein
VAEKNNGGEMVEAVIKQVDPTVNVRLVWASRGKATRAEPIAAIAEQGRDHHVGTFPALEDELCLWQPGDNSPNRLDAKVWAYTDLVERNRATIAEWDF